ncbi:MAG TPA: P63C domain-containing protein, partial [Ktedonobacteraceae bacterium]
ALQIKLRLYLEEEMRKWESTFPDELWREFGRLTHWQGSLTQRPKYWGKLVMELIYEYLDHDVAEWLRKNNLAPKKGQNHHQWLSAQYGLRRLLEHIWMVIGLAKACNSMRELQTRMAELYGRQPIQYTLFLPPPTQPARAPQTKSLKPSLKDNSNVQVPLSWEE